MDLTEQINVLKRGMYFKISNAELDKEWEKVLKKHFPDLCVIRGCGRFGVEAYFCLLKDKHMMREVRSHIRWEAEWTAKAARHCTKALEKVDRILTQKKPRRRMRRCECCDELCHGARCKDCKPL